MAQSLWLFGTQLSILADESQTESLYDLIEGTFQAGVETPLHLHKKYSEVIYVLEGELTVYTDTDSIVLSPGKSYMIPKGTPHLVAAIGSVAAKALTVASPSGFARLIRSLGTTQPPADPMAPEIMERFIAISIEIGDENLAPPGYRPVLK